MSEIESHGFESIPGDNLNSLTDVAIETCSNNLGFYNQVFQLTISPSVADLEAEPEERVLTIEAVEFSKDRLLRDEIVTVRAIHHLSHSPGLEDGCRFRQL